MSKRETITAQELAAYWGVPTSTVYSAVRRGEVPGFLEAGSKGARFYFDKEVVLAEWVPPKVRSWAKDLTAPGNFMKGGSGLTEGGGRTAIHNAAIARLHELHVLVTPARWEAIVLSAVEQAEAGDRHARKWLGDYLMGPPVQRVEAEVGVSVRKGFTDDMRAKAIEALLQSTRERVVIDVEPNEPNEPDTN